MKQYKTSLFVSAIILAAAAGIGPVKASAAVSGGLIKGSSAAVYFLGGDGKRYVFPNDKAYFSWYPDFSQVQTVSDATLASYPLGGNVTYRPGGRLVKIQSDPRVYAVSQGGVLRWISSESAANSIFGANWNKQVDDIADAFFINYKVGNPIASVGDYNPAAAASADANINLDKSLGGGQQAGAAGNAGTVSISLSPYSGTLSSGQSTTVTASAFDTDGVASVVIYASATNKLVQTCPSSGYPASATCSLNLYSNDYVNGSNISVYAQATDRYGNIAVSSAATLAVQNGVTSGSGAGTVTISLSPYSSTLLSGQSTTVTASASDVSGIASMGIYVNGSLYQTCPVANYPTSNSCSTSIYGSSYTNGSSVSVYAQATDRYNNVATSSTTALTTQNTSANGGTVSLSLSPYSSTLASTQSTTVTATASDADGIASMGIYVNGSLLQSCPASSYPTGYSCSMILYGNNYLNYSTVSVYAQATDRYNNTAASSTSTLTIQNAASVNAVTLSLSPYSSTLLNGQSTTATATASDSDGIASMGIYVNGLLLQSCPVTNYPASNVCSTTLYGGNYANGSTISVNARATDRYGNVITSSTSNLTSQNSAATGGSNSVALSFSPYSSALLSGQSTTATATAYNASGITSMNIYLNGSSAQTCPVSGSTTSATCSLVIYGGNYANGSTVSVYAQASDLFNNTVTSQTSNLAIGTAAANGGSNNGSGTVSLSLSPYSSTLTSGQSTTATANAYNAGGIMSVSIFVNGSAAKTCPVTGSATTAACSLVVYGGNYAAGSTISVYASAADLFNNTNTSPTYRLAH
jgi:hypothetical protein